MSAANVNAALVLFPERNPEKLRSASHHQMMEFQITGNKCGSSGSQGQGGSQQSGQGGRSDDSRNAGKNGSSRDR